MRQGEQGERRGTVDAAVLAFADVLGIYGSVRTTGANGGVVITSSVLTGVPGDKPLGWTATAAELSVQSGSWTLEVCVICVKATG